MKILGRNSALSTRIEAVVRCVAALDPEIEAAAMLDQILRARPDIEAKMNAVAELAGAQPDASARILRALGSIMVERVKELPGQVDVLIARIDDPATDPAVRCALASVLAYVSQGRDLVPDDAPGGYGFVDDCAMLTAAHLHMLEPTTANAARIEVLQQTLDGLQSMLPVQVNADMQQAIEGLILLVQSIRVLPAEVAEGLVQQVLDDPEGVVPPQPAPGSRMPEPVPSQKGHWSGGAYFEGDNVIIPGGPSLIDGQLFIPDS